MKKNDDATVIARRISEFLYDYAPQFLTNSAHTLKVYNDTLTLYFKFLEESGVSPSSLDRHHLEKDWIEKWILWLKNTRNNSPETCNNRLASLRRFLEYIAGKDIKMGYLYQEAKRIKRQKCPKRKVSGLSREAVTAMLEAPDTDTAIGRRDLVFLTLLYATAARMDEILSLRIRDINLNAAKPYINLHGKGDKIRTSYLLPRAAALVKKYMKEVHGNTPDEERFLFYSRVGGNFKKLTEAAMDKRIKKHAKTAHGKCAEVPLNSYAHLFRHAKASHWIEDGLSVVEVQFLLGHEQIETTMRYLDITTADKVKALATLENEKEQNLEKKWKNADSSSLTRFCGLNRK
ncbi:MAG: tyrosine-type recombinase/integrase [Eubacterium sp.]|nr:tyrosine-type recombinase/integrase [Eubacterium sp.]